MAVTVANQTPIKAGNKKIVLQTIAFDSSYPTNGEALTIKQLGLTYEADQILIMPFNGYTFKYDKTNAKVLAYGSAGNEVANTTDLSALTAVQVLAIGY